MDPEPEVIREQIEETRNDLTSKLETLEEQVKDTITNVTQTVENTIGAVKSTVEDTVETVSNKVEDTVENVRRTFDVPYQVQKHPWGMTTGFMLAGLGLGYVLSGRRSRARHWDAGRSTSGRWGEASYQPSSMARPAPEPPHRSEPGMLSGLLQAVEAEAGKLKGMAVAVLLGMARDYLKQAVPPALTANVEEILNNMTRRAGGDPIQGPIFSSSQQHQAHHA
jgi:ElaB/YqjD/DUF883 family membrane-anchored ribosome-binding protein